MHLAAGGNPTVTGGAAGLNLAIWALVQILIVGKMRCLFSMVFGASVILLTSRIEERSGANAAADIYYQSSSSRDTVPYTTSNPWNLLC